MLAPRPCQVAVGLGSIPVRVNFFVLQVLYQRIERNLRAEFLVVNGAKVLRVFLLAVHRHLHWRILPPPPPPLSNSGLKLISNVNNVYGDLKAEISQDYAQKPQPNCTFMNSASGQVLYSILWYCSWWRSKIRQQEKRGSLTTYSLSGILYIQTIVQKTDRFSAKLQQSIIVYLQNFPADWLGTTPRQYALLPALVPICMNCL